MFGLADSLMCVHRQLLSTCLQVHSLDGIRHKIGLLRIITYVTHLSLLGLNMISFVLRMQQLRVMQR